MPAPLLFTSTPNSLRQLYTSSEDSREEWNVLCVVCVILTPPLVFIGGSHGLFLLEPP